LHGSDGLVIIAVLGARMPSVDILITVITLPFGDFQCQYKKAASAFGRVAPAIVIVPEDSSSTVYSINFSSPFITPNVKWQIGKPNT